MKNKKVKNYIKKYKRDYSNLLAFNKYDEPIYQEWLTIYHGEAIADIARKETINEICKYLKKNFKFDDYGSSITSGVGIVNFDLDKLINDIKNYGNKD